MALQKTKGENTDDGSNYDDLFVYDNVCYAQGNVLRQ